jgi:NADH-quinone oxidoreductase subunit G
MPTIVIDNQEIEVASGTKVIEAAESLGIMIPRFCYHPALGSVGACRVCAVSFLEGPVKGVQMSCMVEAKDGMVVSTTDEHALEFRKFVIECLMMNHPHDCPVCDEGGHCLLQDMTVSGGHGIRRYPGLKRTYRDQNLGPLIAQEMNRCIHCYRCARYYQELTGYTDFGVLRIGNRTSYGRFRDGALESPFAGNLVDICPTGVFTDKPSRFKGRRWDYERCPSLCIHCSLGCHTIVSARYREIVRQEARFSGQVNGHFICDRGRYGFYYANLESRPRQATVDGRPVLWNEACRKVFERLKKIEKQVGVDRVACLGSIRSSMETHAMLLRICGMKKWKDLTCFIDPALEFKVRAAISRLTPDIAISLGEMADADFILVIGADPVNEAPMLAFEMRQAQRRGAKIIVMDPRPVFLPFEYQHLPVIPDQLNSLLGGLLSKVVSRDVAQLLGEAALECYDAMAGLIEAMAPSFKEEILSIAQTLQCSRRPVLVCGTRIVTRSTPGLAADAALFLKAMNKAAGLFYLMPGANAFGAGLLPGEGGAFEKIITDIEAGRIRALIVVENDPFLHFRDFERLSAALNRLDLLVVLDYIPSEVAKRAHIIIPTETLYEAGGVFINQEGRAQMARPVYRGGVPVLQSGAGSHPPRDYAAGTAGGDSLPAWLALALLADRTKQPERVSVREELWIWLTRAFPAFHDLPSISAFPGEGVRILPSPATGEPFGSEWPGEQAMPRDAAGDLTLLPVASTFGTVDLSAFSPYLRALGDEPCLFIHPKDAERQQLLDGDRVALELESGTVEVTLQVRSNMASGILFLPRHRELANSPVRKLTLKSGQIIKVSGQD